MREKDKMINSFERKCLGIGVILSLLTIFSGLLYYGFKDWMVLGFFGIMAMIFMMFWEEKRNSVYFVKDKMYLKDIGLIAIAIGIVIGIVIGMALSWMFMFISVDSFINNILPNIQIENINFDLNEAALVEGINKTFGG